MGHQYAFVRLAFNVLACIFIAFLENTCFEVPKLFTVSSDFTDFSNVIVSDYACAGLFKYPLSCHETKPQSINVPAYVLVGLANECKR